MPNETRCARMRAAPREANRTRPCGGTQRSVSAPGPGSGPDLPPRLACGSVLDHVHYNQTANHRSGTFCLNFQSDSGADAGFGIWGTDPFGGPISTFYLDRPFCANSANDFLGGDSSTGSIPGQVPISDAVLLWELSATSGDVISMGTESEAASNFATRRANQRPCLQPARNSACIVGRFSTILQSVRSYVADVGLSDSAHVWSMIITSTQPCA